MDPAVTAPTSEVADAPERVIQFTVSRYDHQRGGDWPGMRGVVIDANRHSNSTRVFTPAFPSVWLSDNGEVDLDEYRWLTPEFLAWIDAIRPHVVEAIERRAQREEPKS